MVRKQKTKWLLRQVFILFAFVWCFIFIATASAEKVIEQDTDNDKITDQRLFYDKNNRLIRIELDSDQNGHFETVQYYKNALMLRYEQDKNQDGRPDTLVHFNDKGKRKKVSIDTNIDGKMDQWQFYTDGRLVRMETDSNINGSVDTKTFYSKGKETQSMIDKDHDYFFETRHIYNDPAHSLIIERDLNRDGKPDEVEYYNKADKLIKSCQSSDKRLDMCWFYDEHGEAVRAEKDSNNDKAVDQWFFYKAGKAFRVEQDSNFDGKADLLEYYDDTGAFEKREKDLNFDGIPDLIETEEN